MNKNEETKRKTLNILSGESFTGKAMGGKKGGEAGSGKINRRLIFGKRERVARIKIKSEGEHASASVRPRLHFHFLCTWWWAWWKFGWKYGNENGNGSCLWLCFAFACKCFFIGIFTFVQKPPRLHHKKNIKTKKKTWLGSWIILVNVFFLYPASRQINWQLKHVSLENLPINSYVRHFYLFWTFTESW